MLSILLLLLLSTFALTTTQHLSPNPAFPSLPIFHNHTHTSTLKISSTSSWNATCSTLPSARPPTASNISLAPYIRNVSADAAWVIPASKFDLGAREMSCECFDPDKTCCMPSSPSVAPFCIAPSATCCGDTYCLATETCCAGACCPATTTCHPSPPRCCPPTSLCALPPSCLSHNTSLCAASPPQCCPAALPTCAPFASGQACYAPGVPLPPAPTMTVTRHETLTLIPQGSGYTWALPSAQSGGVGPGAGVMTVWGVDVLPTGMDVLPSSTGVSTGPEITSTKTVVASTSTGMNTKGGVNVNPITSTVVVTASRSVLCYDTALQSDGSCAGTSRTSAGDDYEPAGATTVGRAAGGKRGRGRLGDMMWGVGGWVVLMGGL